MLLNGVRVVARGGERRSGGKDGEGAKERTMAVSLRESVQMVSDPKNLDGSVEEVFRLMLGVECERHTTPAAMEAESVTAVVGFGGVLSGACVFRSGAGTALKIAARMTGMEFDAIDDTVKDAVGEICNMLAGAWKGKVPELAAHCGLSVPAVITGRDYRLHVQAPEFLIHHFYGFGDQRFEVTIVCDGLQ
ncbi:MAG TPA: chemotaxis protein CheX [Terracidiphilus sp.]|nr:chemotaxis protein CheX [Terracidiphilus sp.]